MTIELELIPVFRVYPRVYDPTNDFYIYSCKTESTEVELHEQRKTITIKGIMQRLDIDSTYKAIIEFAENNPKYGVSYNVISIFQEIPKTADGQKNYLKALITENQIREIYKVYPAEDIIELFKTDKFDYSKVRGFGEVVYQRVKQKILENLDYQELFSNLGRYGVGHTAIVKLIEEFGSAEIAIQKVKNNPYELIRVHGIGFKKADAIARNMAKEEIDMLLEQKVITKEEAAKLFIEKFIESPFRIQSAIIHIIEQEQNKGHTYIVRNALLTEVEELLKIDIELIDSLVESMGSLYIEDTKVALKLTYETEVYIADWITERLKNSKPLNFNVEDFISRMEIKYEIKLSDQQKSFFYNVRDSNVNLLVGYAGTGKSLMQKLLKELTREIGIIVKWIAPTGAAAKVLEGYVGEKATTAHRAIGYGRNKKNKDLIEITEDYLANDESSLLDVFIAASILKKIKNPETRLLFIGDNFQVGSIAAGNLLHDLLISGKVPTTMLDVVFRQGEGGILDIVTKIRLNQKFIDNDFVGMKKFGDNMFIHCVEQQWMVDGYKHYYNKFLKKYKPDEIMVLTPTKKGDLGTHSINKVIQEIVNPKTFNSIEIEYQRDNEEGVFRVGDYVMNTKNTYDISNIEDVTTEIVNGDTGTIYDLITEWKAEEKKKFKKKNITISRNVYADDEIEGEADESDEDKDENGIYINFDSDDIQFPLQNKLQLIHAWGRTVHKAQGSAAKCVVVIVDQSHTWQWNANLLYTAGTRPEDYCVIVCQPKVINDAMRKVDNLRRNTFLQGLMLREEDIG